MDVESEEMFATICSQDGAGYMGVVDCQCPGPPSSLAFPVPGPFSLYLFLTFDLTSFPVLGFICVLDPY